MSYETHISITEDCGVLLKQVSCSGHYARGEEGEERAVLADVDVEFRLSTIEGKPVPAGCEMETWVIIIDSNVELHKRF